MKCVISVLGKDRSGIVAAVAVVLLALVSLVSNLLIRLQRRGAGA